VIAVLTDPGVGGTFLTWTLHYLAGHKQFFNSRLGQWDPLLDSPLQKNNAHGFAVNQPLNLDQFYQIHNQLNNTPADDFHTIYFHHFTGSDQSHNKDTAQAISALGDCKKIVLTNSPKHVLYRLQYHTRGNTYTKWKDHSSLISDDQQAWFDFIEYFYADSLDQWGRDKLQTKWDLREFLALNIRPFEQFKIDSNIDLTNDHYLLDTMELWTVFDHTVQVIFDYLGIELFQPRMENWTKIYKQWQQIHRDRLLFVWYFDTIVDYILQGIDFDLTRFNLDVIQEASIQHQLIYKHKLNLKTWQLDKFTNTQQLHQLLEPSSYNF
jgi:hypothetical protein